MTKIEAQRTEYRNIRAAAVKDFGTTPSALAKYGMTIEKFNETVAKYVKEKTPAGYLAAAKLLQTELTDCYHNDLEAMYG